MSVALFLRTESSVSGFRMDERASERACRERAIREIAGHVRPRIIALDQKCEAHSARHARLFTYSFFRLVLNSGITHAGPHSLVVFRRHRMHDAWLDPRNGGREHERFFCFAKYICACTRRLSPSLCVFDLACLRDMEPRAVSNKRKHAEEEHRNCTSGKYL